MTTKTDSPVFTDTPEPLGIELLVLPGATLMLVAAVIEPLRAANRLLGRAQFSWHITTPDGLPADTQAGIPIPAAARFAPAGAAPLFVTASYGWQAHARPALLARLASAARTRPLIAGIESGALLLARAGLLNGRRATTHWEDIDTLTADFPEVEVVAERFVIDGARATTGGTGPALELMLTLIRRRLGYALALEIAKLFVTEQAAPAAQSPALALARPRDPAVARAVAAMEANLDEPLPIDRVARLAGISARHLQNRFRAVFGVAPHAHYLALRLAHARRLLIETEHPVLEIAGRAGFSGASAFARAYRQAHGETPAETRRTARA